MLPEQLRLAEAGMARSSFGGRNARSLPDENTDARRR
jgi:hypothetical protein